MSAEIFLLIYVLLIIFMIMIELLAIKNNKGPYLKTSYQALKIISDKSDNIEDLSKGIVRFYNEYVQEQPQILRFFPNVIVWIDAIIFRIDSGYKSALILVDNVDEIKNARDILEAKNPYNKCEKYQQGILCDISKLETTENSIVVHNLLDRTEEEFLRLSCEIQKNNRLNVTSIAIGVIGIIVSILMAMLKL
nr:MAG TPA: hypothetical protein [Caudoviricetes sp.]